MEVEHAKCFGNGGWQEIIVFRYDNLSDEQKKFVTNGCGDDVFNVPDLIFNDACCRHDFYYWLGHTDIDRRNADKQFLRNMLDAAYNHNCPKGWKIFYIIMAIVYYIAVRLFSSANFYYGPSYKTMDDLNREMRDAKILGPTVDTNTTESS